MIDFHALEPGWSELMDACDAQSGGRERAFKKLVAAYSEPARYYHTLDHVACMLQVLEKTQVFARMPRLVELAIWYHDAVYDSHRSDNELRSASLAHDALSELGISQERIAPISDWILCTKDHTAPESDTDAHLFLDIDLGILAAIPTEYIQYSDAIRREYAWAEDREYFRGRRIVLERFLARPNIYRSDCFSQWKWEERARANLVAEITQIDARLRSLP